LPTVLVRGAAMLFPDAATPESAELSSLLHGGCGDDDALGGRVGGATAGAASCARGRSEGAARGADEVTGGAVAVDAVGGGARKLHREGSCGDGRAVGGCEPG